VDKTRFIPLLEQSANYLFLIRPRRFGKSLLLSIIEDYYDIYRKDLFKDLFANTYISTNPTAEQGEYLVLSFNFSAVNPGIDKVEASFEWHCRNCFSLFNYKYKHLFDENYIVDFDKAQNSYDKLEYIYYQAKRHKLKLYVIIDEYDNFANTILTTENGENNYKKLTHDDGFFRFFFNKLKAGTTGSDAAISKLFITGVSPITMDDVTSGFNIGLNISTNPVFNEIVGFTEDEVLRMIEYYKSKGKIQQDVNLMPMLTQWYGGYRFSKKIGKMTYNSDCILFFIHHLLFTGEQLENPIDPNVTTDYSKLQHLIILDKKLNGNFSHLKSIIENSFIISNIQQSFSLHELIQPESFISLLYYFGLITISGTKAGRTILKIPNETIKSFFSLYIKNSYKATNTFNIEIYHYSNLIQAMAYEGEWQNVFTFLSEEVKKQTAIRDYINGEAMIKGFLLAYLNITDHYMVISEKEMNKGFADIYLEPFFLKYTDMTYSYLIEVKYINRSVKNTKKSTKDNPDLSSTIEQLVTEATTQLNSYVKDDYVQKTKKNTELRKLILVYHGWELVKFTEHIGY
jgi:hypothetical protein